MITAGNVFDYLCETAPLDLQMDFDNSGFLIGHKNSAVNKILVALDITSEVINEAVDVKAELIVSHHPVIFHPLKHITDESPESARVLFMAEKHISAICMHTNMDIAKDGVNDALLASLGLPSGEVFDGCGRITELETEMPLDRFLALCKSRLNANGIRYHDAGRPVRHLAVMGGAGGSSLESAYRLGCDTYLTADIKHDRFISAHELGINLVDGGHFCTEYPIVPVLAAKLEAKFPELEIIISRCDRQIPQFY